MKRMSAAVLALVLLGACATLEKNSQPACTSEAPLRLMSSAVPDAAFIPCIRAMPLGWNFGALEIKRADARFDISTEGASIQVHLRERCDTSSMSRVRADESEGIRRYHGVSYSNSEERTDSAYVFDGGCITYALTSSEPIPRPVARELAHGVVLKPVSSLGAHQGDEM